MGIKTRTRTFVAYLRSQFADRYEFFIENAAEGYDVVHVGDRAKFRNFEIHVDYVMNQVLLYGVRVMRSMLELETALGKVRRVVAPDWATKDLKIKRQVERLMTRKNQKKVRMVSNETRSAVMMFSF